VRTRELETSGPEETEALGAALGRACRGGELIGLVGELGAGKTCLVRGLASGLGLAPERVQSPSFTIVAEHRGGRLVLQHVDLYRLERPLDDELSLRDVLYGEGVAAVEWFDRLLPAAGDEFLLVTIRYVGDVRRTIHLEAHGAHHQELLRISESA
jgi:tRNA threonylcarbamoyladenosine biosynthesis protein TsaE